MNKIYFYLILLFIFVLHNCAVGPESNSDILVPEEFDMYLCKSINTETIASGKFKGQRAFLSADGVTDEFIVGNGKKAYVIAHWFDLIPKKKYEFKFKWYLPDGRILGVKRVTQKVVASDWVVHNHLNLDNKYKHPSGVWSIDVYINGNQAGKRKFIVAKNRQELKQIKSRIE